MTVGTVLAGLLVVSHGLRAHQVGVTNDLLRDSRRATGAGGAVLLGRRVYRRVRRGRGG